MKIASNTQRFAKQQQGATLIIALIILAVMGIITTSTMNDSILQERMANNSRQKAIANAAAESALREAEQWLFDTVNSREKITEHFLITPTQGCYSDREIPSLAVTPIRKLSNSITDIGHESDWLDDTTTSRTANEINSAWQNGDWARTPRVVIELLGPIRAGEKNSATGSVQNLDADSLPSHDSPWVFRVTAIGWSKNPDIYSVLQSTYTTGRQFGG